MGILEKKYTELFKTDLINRNIKDKCFVSNKNINRIYDPGQNEVNSKYVEYFRVREIKYVYYNSITLVCDFFFSINMKMIIQRKHIILVMV